MMKAYYLWDYYEDYGFIGDYDTEEEARAAAEEWIEETDGECRVAVFGWCVSTNGYEEIGIYSISKEE